MRATISGLLVEAQRVEAQGDKPAGIRGALLIRGDGGVRSDLVRFYGRLTEETAVLSAASEMSPVTLDVDVFANKSQFGDGVSISVKVIRCVTESGPRPSQKVA